MSLDTEIGFAPVLRGYRTRPQHVLVDECELPCAITNIFLFECIIGRMIRLPFSAQRYRAARRAALWANRMLVTRVAQRYNGDPRVSITFAVMRHSALRMRYFITPHT